MLITYRRTGGAAALLTIAVVALAATVVTVAVATFLIVAVAVAGAALAVRAALTSWWRPRAVSRADSWPQRTIETTVVPPAARRAVERDLIRMDSDAG